MSFQNGTNTTSGEQIYGWVQTSNDRGTIDILWSSCITIFLCCWVSTYPNAGSGKDKWYHALYDKFTFSLIAFLGPELLFGIALGQFCSARRSVKARSRALLLVYDVDSIEELTTLELSQAFKKLGDVCRGAKWTLSYGFFADMGGIHLVTSDYPGGFPINAEQLIYLVEHRFINFPDMESMCIDERNSADTLSR